MTWNEDKVRSVRAPPTSTRPSRSNSSEHLAVELNEQLKWHCVMSRLIEPFQCHFRGGVRVSGGVIDSGILRWSESARGWLIPSALTISLCLVVMAATWETVNPIHKLFIALETCWHMYAWKVSYEPKKTALPPSNMEVCKHVYKTVKECKKGAEARYWYMESKAGRIWRPKSTEPSQVLASDLGLLGFILQWTSEHADCGEDISGVFSESFTN